MTPLAMKVANELTLPKAQRMFDDRAHVLDLFDQEMHCFEVSALSKSVNAVLDDPLAADDPDAAWSAWRDIETMLPRMFLPSPVTWLEQSFNGERLACVLREVGGYFSLMTVHDSRRGGFSLKMCDFRARSILEDGDRIDLLPICVEEALGRQEGKDFSPAEFLDLKSLDPAKVTREQVQGLQNAKGAMEARIEELNRETEIVEAGLETTQMCNRFLGMCILTLDLINTPGLIGLRQHDPHRGLARKLASLRGGSYPLHSWSEVVLKHETRRAEPGEQMTGATYHKCLHFVRSHLRHYQDGRVITIPAHWRGDPALGIKRTRYRLAA